MFQPQSQFSYEPQSALIGPSPELDQVSPDQLQSPSSYEPQLAQSGLEPSYKSSYEAESAQISPSPVELARGGLNADGTPMSWDKEVAIQDENLEEISLE